MSRVNLRVSFEDKDEVKALGARWDPVAKSWYVPDGVDATPFREWMPRPVRINLRADRFFMGYAIKRCWKCEARTRVYTVILSPRTFRYVERYDEDTGRPLWWGSDEPRFISSIEFINNEEAQLAIARCAPTYMPSVTDGDLLRTYENYCEACSAKQGLWHMYNEPDGCFFCLLPGGYTATDISGASNIRLVLVDRPLVADADGDILLSPIFRAMQKDGIAL